jgi:hypothetical protein
METKLLHRAQVDYWGIVFTVLCFIHCVLMPLLFQSLPILGMELTENLWIEGVLLLLTLWAGIRSIVLNYMRDHHRLWPLLLFAGGYLLMIASVFISPAESILKILGAPCLAGAHLLNLSISRKCHRHKMLTQ